MSWPHEKLFSYSIEHCFLSHMKCAHKPVIITFNLERKKIKMKSTVIILGKELLIKYFLKILLTFKFTQQARSRFPLDSFRLCHSAGFSLIFKAPTSHSSAVRIT